MQTVHAWGVWVMQNWQFALTIIGTVFVVLGCRWLLSEQRKQLKAQKMPEVGLINYNTPLARPYDATEKYWGAY